MVYLHSTALAANVYEYALALHSIFRSLTIRKKGSYILKE